jgi:hypothetical protein
LLLTIAERTMFERLTQGDLPQAAWSFLWALLTVLVALAICTPLVRWLRERRYAIGETDGSDRLTSRATIAREFELPEADPDAATIGPLLDALHRPVNDLHKKANAYQRAYHNRAARCVICLAVALIMLGLSLTVYADSKAFKAYASAIDVFALLITFQQWLSALGANQRWVATRTKTELLRQWAFLTTLLNWNKPEDAIAMAPGMFERKERDIEDNVVQDRLRIWWRRLLGLFGKKRFPATKIEERMAAYWSSSRDEHARKLAGLKLPPGDLALYIYRRPIRQLAWFRLAQVRLHQQAKHRERWLATCYTVSVVLALIKLAMVYQQEIGARFPMIADLLGALSINAVSMALLAMTVLSTAATALYLSRNDRSLLHRYAAQERAVEGWLKEFCGAPKESAAGEVDRLEERLLDFEALMVDEMIDWLHISAHDTLELAV